MMFTGLSALIGALLLAPQPADAFNLTIYCSNLPGCGPGVQDFIPNLLTELLIRFPVYAYILGTLFIMIGGGYMVLSGFNEEWMTKGKNTIIWAVVGIFVGQFAGVYVNNFIVPEANSIGGGDLVAAVIDSLVNPTTGTIINLFRISLLGVALYCGMRMVVSRGTDDEFNKARDGLFYAAIGAVIINLAGLLANAIATL